MTKNDSIPPSEALLLPLNEEETPGRMLTAVERDLRRMEDLNTGVRGSLAALARELARAMDATDDDQPTPAQIGQLGQQLRTTLLALAEVASDSTATEAFFRLMSTAVRSANDGDSCPHCGNARDADGVQRQGPMPVPSMPRGKGPSIPGMES